MKRILLLATIIVLLQSCQKEPHLGVKSFENSEVAHRSMETIKVLSWNTQLLDSPGSNDNNPQCDGDPCWERANAIADYIINLDEDFEIIALQEVFENEARDIVVDRLNDEGYWCHESDNGSLWEEGAGLVTCFDKTNLSLYSHNINFYEFNSCDGDLISGCDSDCLANKGFARYDMTFKSNTTKSFRFVNTHLDAGSCSGAFDAREDQIDQIYTYAYSVTSLPVLLAGDLNIDGTSSYSTANLNQFDYMLNKFDATPGFEFGTTPGLKTATYSSIYGFTKRLDYVLVTDSNNDIQNVDEIDLGFNNKDNFCVECSWPHPRRGNITTSTCGTFSMDSYNEALNWLNTHSCPNSNIEQLSYSSICGSTIQSTCPPSDHLPIAFEIDF